MLEASERAQRDGSPLDLMPGHFLTLSLHQRDGMDLETMLAGRPLRSQSPSLAFLQRQLPHDAALPAVELGLKQATRFGVNSQTDLCLLVGAVVQTLQPLHNRMLAVQNRAIAKAAFAETEPPPAPEPPAPSPLPRKLGPRPDEVGQYCSVAGLSLWHASYLGVCDKQANQDATYACTDGRRIYFALADGVTTSIGSREAALIAAEEFCKAMCDRLAGRSTTPREYFPSALGVVRQRLDAVLDYLVATPTNRQIKELFEGMEEEFIRYMIGATAKGHARRPLLATTLIGGVMTPSQGGAQIDLLRVGDGIAEHIDRLGQAVRRLDMNSEESAIPNYVGPRQQPRFDTSTFDLAEGEWLLASSDGLARGHRLPVADELAFLLNSNPASYLHADDEHSAARLLRAVEDRVGAVPDNVDLMKDNWSVIWARVGNGSNA
jgi:hypothetical protein